MLKLGELSVQTVHNLRGNLVVDIAGLWSLHAVRLALARHAVLHHVDMRHVCERRVRALLTASVSLLQSSSGAGDLWRMTVRVSHVHRWVSGAVLECTSLIYVISALAG
jgi:hypothetical protein